MSEPVQPQSQPQQIDSWAYDTDFVSWLRSGQFRNTGPIKWRRLLDGAKFPSGPGTIGLLILSMWEAWKGYADVYGRSRITESDHKPRWSPASEKPKSDGHYLLLFRHHEWKELVVSTGFFHNEEMGITEEGGWESKSMLVGWYQIPIPALTQCGLKDVVEKDGPISTETGLYLTAEQHDDLLVKFAKLRDIHSGKMSDKMVEDLDSQRKSTGPVSKVYTKSKAPKSKRGKRRRGFH